MWPLYENLCNLSALRQFRAKSLVRNPSSTLLLPFCLLFPCYFLLLLKNAPYIAFTESAGRAETTARAAIVFT